MRAILGSLLALGLLAGGGNAQQVVEVDLSADWLRRDWHRCQSAARFSHHEGVMAVYSDSTAVLFWQVPTRQQVALPVDARLNRWLRRCERPSLDFWQNVRNQDAESPFLLQVGEYPHLSWSWQVMDRRREGDGRPRDEDVLEVGVAVLKKGGSDLRELIYAWSHKAAVDSLSVREVTVIPGIWKYRKAQVVVATGRERMGGWVEAQRDLYADYKRAFPKEEPGRVARIYVKVSGDVGRQSLEAHFARMRFARTASGAAGGAREDSP